MEFIEAFEARDLTVLKSFPKSDLHNHATRGGNIRDFLDDLDLPPRDFRDLDEMQCWYDTNVKVLFSGKAGFCSRVESAFRQAKSDGVTRLALSFGMGDAVHFESVGEYLNEIGRIYREAAPGIDFIPELCLARTDDIAPVEEFYDEVLSYLFFKSIDLVGDDRLPVSNFKNIYAKAKAHGFILKAHLGEFGNVESVRRGVEELELDEVQHGISAATSTEFMGWLRDNDILLNICPSSNVMLNRANSYKDHPIKELFHHGIPVTINSDDMLIFDQSVTQDYINLYENGCLTAGEVNRIRETGLQP